MIEKYPNIMKFVDNKLEEQENTINFYRKKQTEWEEERTNLTTKISYLEATISDLKADNEKYINEIKRLDKKVADYETPKKVANV
jgi:septal ring factor EnvC (AmiA/AmiB activator)